MSDKLSLEAKAKISQEQASGGNIEHYLILFDLHLQCGAFPRECTPEEELKIPIPGTLYKSLERKIKFSSEANKEEFPIKIKGDLSVYFADKQL